MAELKVELVSAESTVWAGTASMVVARTTDGEIGILPGHEPMLGLLAQGAVRITPVSGGGPVNAKVDGGFLSVDHDMVLLVADRASVG